MSPTPGISMSKASFVMPAQAGIQFFFAASCAVLAACGSTANANAPVAAEARNLPPGAQFDTDQNCPSPRCFDVQVPLPEGVAVTDNHVRVILPIGYGDGRKYPLLYL